MSPYDCEMEGFFSSFQPFFSRFRAEIILLSAALIVLIASGTMYVVQTNNGQKTPVVEIEQSFQNQKKQYVSVDISGAVKKPGVYQFIILSRFNDALQKAGGLTDEADKSYVERNFNLARILTDQEKIYIPYQIDTASGIVEENKRILDYTTPAVITSQTTEQEKSKIDINLATIEELDTLTGIGKVQADTIIKSRPYKNIEDLVSKNVLRSTIYEKIKNEIVVN